MNDAKLTIEYNVAYNLTRQVDGGAVLDRPFLPAELDALVTALVTNVNANNRTYVFNNTVNPGSDVKLVVSTPNVLQNNYDMEIELSDTSSIFAPGAGILTYLLNELT